VQLTTGEINQKILITLHKHKYDIVVSGLHEKDLDKLEVYQLVNKIKAHDMSVHGETKEASMLKDLAFVVKTRKKTKKKAKNIAIPSSSSSEDSSNEGGEDGGHAFLMRRRLTKCSQHLRRRDSSMIKKNKSKATNPLVNRYMNCGLYLITSSISQVSDFLLSIW